MSEEEGEQPEDIEGVFQDLAQAHIIEPAWVIEDFLPVGLSFLAGPPKGNKSTLTMAAACMVAGYECNALPEFLRKVPEKGSVLVFSYEAEAGELRYMVECEMNVKLRADESILIADDPFKYRLDDPKGIQTMLFWMNQRRPKLVILDPLIDFHSIDENDSGAMNRLLRPLRTWAIKNNASFLVVHHMRKPGEGHTKYDFTDMRGTSALFGIADGLLAITPIQKRTNCATLRTKFKRAKSWERTLQFSIYEDKDKQAGEVLADKDMTVLARLRTGAATWEELGNLGDGPAVREILAKLQRNGLVGYGNGVWRATNA